MDKPLKDWTLGECQEHCSKVLSDTDNCKGCALVHIFANKCIFCDCPRDIDFNAMDARNKKPRFTQQEVEDAKTLKRLFGEYKIAEFGARHVFGGLRLNEDAFPSLQHGQSYTLDEIIGGAE